MKLCSGCFEKYDERLSMCPFCGYEEGDEKESNSYLDVGTMLNNKYVIGAAIGNGGFGVTYYAWDINLQQKLAIKEYLPSEFSTRMQGKLDIIVFKGEKEEQFNVGLEKFVGEANKLVEFRDTEGVVRIQESFFEFGTAYIVMEYLDGETLSKYLSENPMNSSEKTISMMMPIIQSLKQIHAKGILHRDISPDNIIITKEGKAKLIDFGASRHETATKTRSMSVITKAGYSPEEQYRNSGDQGAYTDVYALAATMYHMITGVKPPISIERNAYYKEKKKDLLEPILNYNKEISENEEIAIANALNIKIEQRTESMDIFEKELTSDTPIKRRDGSIKATDLLTWPLWLKISVPSFATCLMTLILLFSFGIIGFNANLETELVVASGLTRVPLIVSDEIEEATLKLESASLNYQIVGKSYSEHIPANYILSQDLTAGMLINTNSIVSVLISAGSEESLTFKDANGMYTLADVQFQEVETATTILETQEMSVIIVEEYNDTVASGLVISQYPEAGTLLLPGEEITLTVSKGGEGFTLPSFVDMTEDEARATLSQLGLVVSVEYNNESDLPDGTVISQDIKDGTIVMLGSTVSLVVSSYKDLEDIPDVVGLTQSEATKILESLGYVVQVNVLDSTQINFKVLSQSPQSGLSAEIGSTVIINMLGDDVVKETATPTATATPTPTPTPTATPTPTPTATATPTP
ncbi:MAG: PASTA domain-containing protein, partial [Clostridia bacterium]